MLLICNFFSYLKEENEDFEDFNVNKEEMFIALVNKIKLKIELLRPSDFRVYK